MGGMDEMGTARTYCGPHRIQELKKLEKLEEKVEIEAAKLRLRAGRRIWRAARFVACTASSAVHVTRRLVQASPPLRLPFLSPMCTSPALSCFSTLLGPPPLRGNADR